MFSFVLFFCFYFIFYFFHFLFCSLHSSCVLCNLCCQFLWICYSWLNLRFSLTFIYRFISNWIYYYCHTFHKISFVQGQSWSYGSWIDNNLCNQCLSPLKLWDWTLFMARCTWYNIMWSSLSVTCDRMVVFSGTPVSSTNKTDRATI